MHLSGIGLYLEIASAKKRLLPTAHHFEVNAALWSDGAKKKRWVLVPSGQSITYYDTVDYYDYPDSTVFVKQFAIDTISGDSNSRVLWETRLLINHKESDKNDTSKKELQDDWYGFSYKWNKDQKDAKLVEGDGYSGMNDSIKVWPNGLTKLSRMKKWVFPSSNKCDECHRSNMGYGTPALHAHSVIGFFTAQLNHPHPDSVKINQLE